MEGPPHCLPNSQLDFQAIPVHCLIYCIVTPRMLTAALSRRRWPSCGSVLCLAGLTQKSSAALDENQREMNELRRQLEQEQRARERAEERYNTEHADCLELHTMLGMLEGKLKHTTGVKESVELELDQARMQARQLEDSVSATLEGMAGNIEEVSEALAFAACALHNALPPGEAVSGARTVSLMPAFYLQVQAASALRLEQLRGSQGQASELQLQLAETTADLEATTAQLQDWQQQQSNVAALLERSLDELEAERGKHARTRGLLEEAVGRHNSDTQGMDLLQERCEALEEELKQVLKDIEKEEARVMDLEVNYATSPSTQP